MENLLHVVDHALGRRRREPKDGHIREQLFYDAKVFVVWSLLRYTHCYLHHQIIELLY